MKTLNIDEAIKRSEVMDSSKKKSMKNPHNLNRNISKIGELGREISELQRRKGVASSPEEAQDIQDEIDRKTEEFNRLREEGRQF